MAERRERAALRLAHRCAAMSAVRAPATMKMTTGRPLRRLLPDHDGLGIPQDALDDAVDARRRPRDVRSRELARFSRDARELQSPPPYLPAARQIDVSGRWRHARVRKNAILTAIPRHGAAHGFALGRVGGDSSTTGRAMPIATARATRSATLVRYPREVSEDTSLDLRGCALARARCQRTLPTTRRRHFVRFSIDNRLTAAFRKIASTRLAQRRSRRREIAWFLHFLFLFLLSCTRSCSCELRTLPSPPSRHLFSKFESSYVSVR